MKRLLSALLATAMLAIAFALPASVAAAQVGTLPLGHSTRTAFTPSGGMVQIGGPSRHVTYETNDDGTQSATTSTATVATTRWTDGQGFNHEVATTRRTGETHDQFAARHSAEVTALAILHPPVSSTSQNYTTGPGVQRATIFWISGGFSNELWIPSQGSHAAWRAEASATFQAFLVYFPLV